MPDIITTVLLFSLAISSIVHQYKIKGLDEGLSSCSRSTYKETQKVRKDLEEKNKDLLRYIDALKHRVQQLEKKVEELQAPTQDE